ncbi:sugar MFS transporter [Trinickia diaoshuihuensis]|uniref:sugar MFS transporter n=1 Tax=Trinickia diaoshuihuensis TaxID=2292265 RepID=UPI000E23F6B1|nr:sugar MFS transporter [Trinickia diaoshuihuensis]
MNTITKAAAAHGPSSASADTRHTMALTLVISLFFAWGLTYGLLDVLNKHFQQTLSVSRMESALLQTCYFGAYLLVAIPSGLFVNRYGYRRGILLGLALFSVGALLFVPATDAGRFGPFLFALFVLASGAACLETAANPFVTLLGAKEGGARRLNLAQAFTGLGSFIGPIIGGLFFFQHGTSFASNAVPVKITYVAIAVAVTLLAIAFSRARFPDVEPAESRTQFSEAAVPLWKEATFMASVVAQFFYFSAQVGIAAFFINYATEHWRGLAVHSAAFMLSAGMTSFTVGRFVSTILMRKVTPASLLAMYGTICIALCVIVVVGIPTVSVVALIAVFFFESIMFPTIFALGVQDLGHRTRRAASFQVMALFGGALAPLAMGAVADRFGIALAYLIPIGCFSIVLAFALYGGHRRARP